MMQRPAPRRVSLLALPESTSTPISGLWETFAMLEAVAHPGVSPGRLFEVEIVGPGRGASASATGLPIEVQRSIDEVPSTDIVIAASMLFDQNQWVTGRHAETVEWMRDMHRGGADLASACAGALLLAETGLLDGRVATTHWAFAGTFQRNFPQVDLRIDELLVVTGQHSELIMSGAASSWQDLVLHLIARHTSPSLAQEIGKFLLFDWSTRSQSPFIPFAPPTDHDDGPVRELQEWLQQHPALQNPVEAMARHCGLPISTFKRRFKRATGYSPLRYVQHLRVEEAKRLLERTDLTVDSVGASVGYDEPAAFRRLFKRITAMTPSEYRRKFYLPTVAAAG